MKFQQIEMFDDNPAYEAFEEKFKPKKTSDDCYTPENIYQAVAAWVAREYGVDAGSFVRPFWPGGDYRGMEYPEGCVVVDNPPFSILREIMSFYLQRNIHFFLFAPTLTLFGPQDVCYIPCGVQITYENGASVNTSFVTDLDSLRARSVPDLYAAVEAINKKNEQAQTKQLPKYRYPDHVLTAAAAYQYSHYGIPWRLKKEDTLFIRAMDAQRKHGKSLFGSGFLLSDRAAADRAAADRAAAERAAAIEWQLSDREKRLIAQMGGKDAGK